MSSFTTIEFPFAKESWKNLGEKFFFWSWKVDGDVLKYSGGLWYAIQGAFSFFRFLGIWLHWEHWEMYWVFTGLSLHNFQRKAYHNSLWMIIQIFFDRVSVLHITIFFPSSLSSGASMGRHMLLSHWPTSSHFSARLCTPHIRPKIWFLFKCLKLRIF